MILNPWTNNLIAKGLVKTQKVQLWRNVKKLLHSILLVASDKPYIPDIDSFGCYDLGLGLAKENILGWLLDDGLVRFSQMACLWMCLSQKVTDNAVDRLNLGQVYIEPECDEYIEIIKYSNNFGTNIYLDIPLYDFFFIQTYSNIRLCRKTPSKYIQILVRLIFLIPIYSDIPLCQNAYECHNLYWTSQKILNT